MARSAGTDAGQERCPCQVVEKEEGKAGRSPQPCASVSEGAAAAGGSQFPPISRWRGDPPLLPAANGGARVTPPPVLLQCNLGCFDPMLHPRRRGIRKQDKALGQPLAAVQRHGGAGVCSCEGKYLHNSGEIRGGGGRSGKKDEIAAAF